VRGVPSGRPPASASPHRGWNSAPLDAHLCNLLSAHAGDVVVCGGPFVGQASGGVDAGAGTASVAPLVSRYPNGRCNCPRIKEGLPVRLIVGEGSQRDISKPKSKASRMTLRMLDPEPWSVQRYDQNSGECRLVRGKAPRYVDQYTTPEPQMPARREVSGTVWERDRKVRDAPLCRAKGRCEPSKQRGFRMVGGEIYLETHPIIPMSEQGVDHEGNVAALCPIHHCEAHYGERRAEIWSRLL
jgi:hypothetical protein